jgi:hypothetical protein
MTDNKDNPFINDAFFWGINITINDKTYNNKDIFLGDKKLNKNCENYDDILSNLDLIRDSSSLFLQNIIDQNPQLKNIKEKKENIEIEE